MSVSGVSKSGSDRDLHDLYKSYAGLVYRRCYRLLGSKARAEEATQDVFIKILQAQGTLDLETNPGALLYRIATHVCFNLTRSSRRKPEVANGEALLELAVSKEGGDLDPADRMFVKNLMESEEESTRLMATYHFVDGMTIQEVADEFNMSSSGVKKRLQTFKTKVRLMGNFDGES